LRRNPQAFAFHASPLLLKKGLEAGQPSRDFPQMKTLTVDDLRIWRSFPTVLLKNERQYASDHLERSQKDNSERKQVAATKKYWTSVLAQGKFLPDKYDKTSGV
jgi:hypothetical protein